jgi:SRSO17 transposase
VSVTLASGEVPVMVALSKPEVAIEEIDRIIASGVRFGCVLADAG